MRALHPQLMLNGDVIFNTGYSLLRLSICSNRSIWKLDNLSHHSIELDSRGNIIVPSKSDQKISISKWSHLKWEDDSITTISLSGEIIQIDSFASIFIKNNLTALLIGIGDSNIKNLNPIHINQIKPTLTGSEFWKKYDLLISSRNLSTVFIYRPSIGKIIGHQTGPWMNQHSFDYVDNNSISLFNNNVVPSQPYGFINPEYNNTVVAYDFKANITS